MKHAYYITHLLLLDGLLFDISGQAWISFVDVQPTIYQFQELTFRIDDNFVLLSVTISFCRTFAIRKTCMPSFISRLNAIHSHCMIFSFSLKGSY